MRKSTIAIGIAAALSTQAFVSSTDADAAVKVKPQKASGPNHTQPHFKYPNRTSPTGSTVLYDQSGTAVNGFPSQNFESSFDAYDAAGADDFVVTDAAGWNVSAFNFQITVGDPSTATYDINVYPDAGGLPGGSATCSYAGIPGVVDGTNTSLSVALPSTCSLSQGTYWVSMIGNLDFAVGGQVFWSLDSTTGFGSNAAWQNPGGGFGIGCTTWTDNATCGAGSGLTTALFQVVGAVGGGGGCGAGDLCLVTTVGTDTSAGACATTDTIDVSVGDQVNFCYTITNNTGIELDYHTLSDNINGTIFSLMNQPVADGGTFQYNRIETAGATETVNSSWTGQDVPPGYAAEVTGGGGGGDRIFCDGFDGTACAALPAGGFVDITTTGTPLGLSDDGSADVTMPFSFNFYGTTSNSLSIGNNGGAIFNAPGSAIPFTNASLPSSSLAGPAMLPLWDDFDSESGDVYYDTRGTTPNRQFIVEWFNRVHFNGSSNTDGATFELILNEDGTIQFEYSDVAYTGIGSFGGQDPDDCTGGVCATIGLQNDTTLFNQFSAFEASVTDNSGIRWTPTSPQTFTGTDTATVNVGAPDIDVQPPALTGTVPEGGSSSIPFDINNLGNRDLNWSLDEAGPANLHFPPPGTRFAMPLGDPSKATTARAPVRGNRGNVKPGVVHHAVFGPGTVPVFAADVAGDQFITFDALNPGTVNTVGSAGGTACISTDFIDGDFSKAYCIDGFGSQANTFMTVDTATGALTPIGTSNASADSNGWTGIKYDGTTGNLYASGTTCGSSSHLYTIDVNTGASTLVGELTGMGCVIDIAIDPSGNMWGIDIVSDALFAIDKTTGAASLVGSIGFNANYAQGIDFDDATGTLYYAAFNADTFTDEMRTVDLATGATSLVGAIGAGQVTGMGVMTGGGPCTQPQDLPWLSLSPLTGTTPPSGTSPATASIDGSASVEGDTLSGTVCVNSNDPDEHHVEVPIDVTVGPPGTGGSVVDSGVLNYNVIADVTGLYINWLTGAHCDSGIGGCGGSGPYDFSPYSSGGNMTFYWGGPLAATSNCVATATSCDILASGTTVGAASTFSQADAVTFRGGNTTGYLGFSFVNANTLQVNYGYALFTTTAATGFPATLVEYWYDNSGADITIP